MTGTSPNSHDWNRRRWEWQRLVLSDPNLTDKAKLIACALVAQFFDVQRPEFTPGYARLARALACSVEAIKRGVRSLEAGGWLVRSGGATRGKEMHMQCRFPDQKGGQSCTPIQGGKGVNSAPLERIKGGQSCTPLREERGSNLTRKGVHPAPLSEFPPAPPYKDITKFPQSARDARRPAHARTRGALASVIAAGGEESTKWDAWLCPRGHPRLRDFAPVVAMEGGEGFEVPSRWPPAGQEGTEVLIAERWVLKIRGYRDEGKHDAN